MDNLYDLVVIGAGPAGLTASIYASCFHLKHVVISNNVGGQMLLAPDILNYPGFNNISGKELTERMVEQAKLRGGEIVTGSVVGIQSASWRIRVQNEEIVKGFEVKMQDGRK